LNLLFVNITGGGISGGYRNYLKNILTRLASNSQIKRILCLSPKQLHVRDWFSHLSCTEFIAYEQHPLSRCRMCPEIAQHLVRFSPHVIFVPTERYFALRGVPLVNMVQNMEPFVYSSSLNPISERIKTMLRRRVSCSALRKSQRVIAVSRFVKEHLVTAIGIPERKISVIYHGRSGDGNDVGKKPSAVPDRWRGGFLFTAGSIRPARGLEDIIHAVSELARTKWPVNLVIAGKTDANMVSYQRTLQDFVAQNHIGDRITWAGSLNEAEMKWCYKHCEIFVMTSRVESFGMIGLEAMANGCVCIAANNPCLPEIFEDSAIYYTPRDHVMLAKTIQLLCNRSRDERSAVSKRAIERATDFSWDMCAQQTVAQLAMAAQESTS
jgi:glycosyltransferase involved in cell wall biosynthesis